MNYLFLQRGNHELCVRFPSSSVESTQIDNELYRVMMKSGFIHVFLQAKPISEVNGQKTFEFDFYEGYSPVKYEKSQEHLEHRDTLQETFPFVALSSEGERSEKTGEVEGSNLSGPAKPEEET